MRKRILFIILAGAVCLAPLWAGVETSGEKNPFADKAEELIKGKESSEEKIIALHAFVRDDIEECKTKYS